MTGVPGAMCPVYPDRSAGCEVLTRESSMNRGMLIRTLLAFISVALAATAPGGCARPKEGISMPGDRADDRRELRVALAQPLVIPGDVTGNVGHMAPLIAEAASRGARLVVFSECALTGYDLKGTGAKAAITLEDPALGRLAQLARQHRLAIVAGFYEKLDGRLYNSAAVFLPDGRQVIQRKHNILAPERAACPVVAANRERQIFEIDGVRCALLICSDAGIPGVFDELARSRCDAVVLICAGAGDVSFGVHQAELADPGRLKTWSEQAATCLSAEAIAQSVRLGVAQIACNQAGWDPALGYFHPGGSSIVDRTGEVTVVIPPRFVFEHLRPDLAVGFVTCGPRTPQGER
ncbi:MAG: carbon-nitrogen hydrolase family protein [Planctomycetota bacterium]|nr:carbon-nitrogen hydrolase family protein [Planctomycetota bacterium]